jgi:hypothetical protein
MTKRIIGGISKAEIRITVMLAPANVATREITVDAII